MKKDFKRTTSLMMASMMITMSVFSDVSVSAQDIPELDVMSEVLSSGSALEPGGSSGDAGNDEITEETTETTTEVTEEESEATAEDKTNNGLLEDKEIIDENEGEIEVSVDKTVVAYHGLAEGTVTGDTHDGVEITVPKEIIDGLIKDYGTSAKIYWESSNADVVVSELNTAAVTLPSPSAAVKKTVTIVTGAGAVGKETVLSLNVTDSAGVDLKKGAYKARVKCVESEINDTNVKTALQNSDMIYVDVDGGAKPISIELDKDAGDVTWKVYESVTVADGTLSGTPAASFLAVDKVATGGTPAGTIITTMSADVESEGKYKTTVFLNPVKVGVVYLEATVKSNDTTGTPSNIIVYRKKVNIGLTDKAVVQEKLDAYINGLVDVSFTVPTTATTANATWSISSAANFPTTGPSLPYVGATAAAANAATTAATGIIHDLGAAQTVSEHQATSAASSGKYTVGIALPKMNTATPPTATNIVPEPITLTARIDGAIVYEAVLNVHDKPAINENLDDVSEDPTKHEASYQNATNIKISDATATKIEIPELMDKKYIGNITWEVFNDIAYDKEETITTGSPSPVIGSESSKGTGTATPVQVCDTAAGTFGATASTTDPFVYVKPNTGNNAKAGAMYIQARLNADPATPGSGTVVYVGKVYVNPETVTEERVSFFAGTTDKVFSFSGLEHSGNDLFDADTGSANRSLEWKLKYYEVNPTTGALTEKTDYTGATAATGNSPLKYVQFTDTAKPATDMAISMPVDTAGSGKVRVQATTDAIPADHVVMLVASIKGAEVYKYRITTSTVPNVTQGTTRITDETLNTEIALETPNLGSLNYGDVQWQVYTDSAYTHLASDTNSILKLNPAAGTGSTVIGDKVSVTKPVAEVQENVYKSVIAAKAQGKVGTAYVQAKVDGRVVSKTIVHIGAQEDNGKVVMYNEDKMDLEYTAPNNSLAGKNVLWQQFDAANLPATASDFALNGANVSTVNTIADAITGKINLTITAPNSAIGERLITATVDGVEVYRTIVSSVAQPTTIVSNIDTDNPADTTNDVLTLSKSDATAHLVNLSGLGAVTHSNVKWTAYSQKSDGTGFGDVVNTDTIQFVDAAGNTVVTDSKIIDGIADVYIKNATTAKLGIVEVRGKVNDIDVYKFRVNVIPDAAAISKENKSIFSHTTTGTAVHTLNGTISNTDIAGKNITWAIDTTNGTIDTEQSTKVVPNTGGAVQVVFNVNANITDPFYITGYLGNASDGIKVHEFLVTPVAPPSATDIKDKDRVIAYNAQKGIKLETIDLKGANFNQVEWTVYTDSGYSTAATAANALITLSDAETGGTVGLSKKTNISQTDNKTNVYAQVTSIKDIGANYVQATVDGVAVYQAKINVTKDSIIETDKTIYVNNTHTLKVTLPANVANNTKVVWEQSKNGVNATSFDMNNKTNTHTVDTYVKSDGTNQVATLDIKAAAVAPSTKFTATIDGIVVYEINVSAIERPNITSSIDTNANIQDDTISYVISPATADVTEVTLSGFGNVSNADIEWKIFNLDTDQVNFKNVASTNAATGNAIALYEDDAAATLISNDKTTLANGSTTVYVKNTGAKLTATKVVAYIDGAEIYSFIVGSNPDTGLINTENAAVYSSQKDFEIVGTLHLDLVKAAAADKLLNKDDKITWTTDDAGLIMNTDTRTNTLSEATVGAAGTAGTGEIKLAIKDLSAVKKDVVTVTAYYGDAKFGIKLLEYKIAVNKEANKDDVANQVDFTILKSEIDDQAGNYKGVIELAIDDLAPGLSGNVQWNLYDNYVKSGDAANTIIKDISGKQLLLQGSSATDLVASTTTAITTGTAPAASTTSAKLKVNGYGRVYAVATYNGAVVYRAKINIIDATKKETLTMYVNNSTTLKVDAFANKEILVNAKDIVWTCGNGTEESADIVSLSNQSPTLTGKKESEVTVNAKAKGTAIVRATDADGQVVYENTITVVEQPTVNTIDIKTSVGNDITKTITGLTGFTSGVEWKAYTGTTTTATTNKEIIFNDDVSKDDATTAIDAKGSTSIKFKAGPASVQNTESVYTVVGTVDGIVVARYEVTVSIDTIVEVNKKFADKVEHKISLGDEYKGKDVYWSTGTIEKDKEVQATSDGTNASNKIGLFLTTGGTDIFSAMPTKATMTEGNIYLKSGVAAVDSTTYYIKGICDGVEICKIYFKVTEDETGLTPVTIAKSYKDAVETFTPASAAANDKWIIGTMSDVVLKSDGTVESYTENDPSNSTLQFTAAINKSEYTTQDTDPVAIKTVGTGWSYVKVIKSGKVTDKWYVNVVESPITDVKFTKGIKTAKVNGLDEATASAGNDLEYDLTLYVDNGEIKDNYLVSNNLSKLLLQPTITGTGTATEKELRYTFTNGTTDLTGTSFQLAKNEKGVYYVEPTVTTAGSQESFYIETLLNKGVQVSGADVPLRRIKVNVTLKAVSEASEVNAAATTGSITDGSSTYTPYELLATKRTTPTKLINAGGKLRFRIINDGTKDYVSVAEVEKNTTSGAYAPITADTLLEIPDSTMTNNASTVPEGKWIICANGFDNDNGANKKASVNNAKTSSAAKFSKNGGTSGLVTTINDEGEIYLVNTKSKGTTSNQIWVRYVNKYDTNIVYAQVPVTIAPAKADGMTLKATGMGTMKSGDGTKAGNIDVYSLNATVGSKVSIKPTLTNTSNKGVTYEVVTTAVNATAGVDEGADYTFATTNDYIQISSSGIITPIKATAVAAGTTKTEYVKVKVTSDDNDTLEKYIYITVANPKVNAMILSSGSISLATGNYQVVTLRLNPSYNYADNKVLVNVPTDAPYKVYTDQGCTTEVVAGTGLTITNGMIDLYVKMENDAEIKGKEAITFSYDETGTKVKDVKLTVKRIASQSNITSVVQKNTKEFAAPVGIPYDLKTTVNPATAVNDINWTVNDDAAGNTTTNTANYAITNGWFIPLATQDFYLEGETVGKNSANQVIKTTYNYKVTGYIPATNVGITATDGTITTYGLYAGYLKDIGTTNTTSTTTIPGGLELEVTASGVGAAGGENITWTSSSPSGLPLVENASDATKFTLNTNAKGTYTVTGITEYSKQKYSFKVVVGSNIDISGGTNENINDNLDDIDGTATLGFGLKDGDTVTTITNLDAYAHTENTLTNGKAQQLIVTAEGVAFDSISFASSNTKLLTVSATGMLSPKAETDADEYVTVTVTMTGKAKNADGKTVNVKVTRDIDFSIGHADVSVTNLGSYIAKDTYAVKNKAYTFTAKVKGTSASKVNTAWQVLQNDNFNVADAVTTSFKALDSQDYFTSGKNNTAKVTFDEYATAGDYYIYPTITALDDTTDVYYDPTDENKNGDDPTIPNGATTNQFNFTGLIQKFTLLNNVISTVTTSQKTIDTVKDANGKTFTVYVKGFAVDGEKVDIADVIWTSSNNSIAEIGTIVDGTDGTVAEKFYNSVQIKTKNVSGTATVTGLLRNSGKKVSIKVNVKDTANADRTPTVIKINNNRDLTLKLDKNGNSIKQIDTTFFADTAATKANGAITEEVWTISELKSGGDKTVDTDFINETTFTRDATGVITAAAVGSGAKITGVNVDASGNIITTKECVLKVTKTVKIDGGTAIAMGNDAEGNANNIIITVR